MSRVLVVIPTLNEVDNMRPLIEALLSYKWLDIVIVDDQSTDGTLKAVRELECAGRVFYLSRFGEKGRRSAVNCGMGWALSQPIDWKYFIEMDADFSHCPRLIEYLVPRLPSHALTIGSRYVNGGDSSSLSLFRQLISRIANRVSRGLLGIDVQDITGGFRCYRRDAIVALMQMRPTCCGFAGNIEALRYLIHHCKFEVREIPIYFGSRLSGSSKFSLAEALEAAVYLLKLALVGDQNIGPAKSRITYIKP